MIERSGTLQVPFTGPLAERVARLEAELQAAKMMAEFEQKRAEELISLARQRAEDLKAERDSWKQQAERLTLAPPAPAPAPQPHSRGCWPFKRAG